MRYKDLNNARHSFVKVSSIYKELETRGVIESPFENIPLPKMLKIDIAEYMMYLSASDSKIDKHEVQVFQAITGFRDSAGGIAEYIRENDIYSTDYENTVPHSMIAAVEAEHALAEIPNLRRSTSLPRLLLEVYDTIGLTLILADGDISKNERQDYNIYLNMLRDYVEENGF